jgi:hypothetical protein
MAVDSHWKLQAAPAGGEEDWSWEAAEVGEGIVNFFLRF